MADPSKTLMEMCTQKIELRPQTKLYCHKPRPTKDDDYTNDYWDNHFNRFNSWASLKKTKTEEIYTEEDYNRWERCDWSDEEWDLWVKYGDFYWLREVETPSPSIITTEEEIPSLEIYTPGNTPDIYPSDEDELEAFLDAKCHGSVNGDSDDEDF